MEGEAWDIFSQLPKDLKKLWLESASPATAMHAAVAPGDVHERRAY